MRDLPRKISPKELYAVEPERIEDGDSVGGLLCGCYYNHVPEIDRYSLDWERNKRISVKIVHYQNFDGRRYWQLATVWFDFDPVMVIQNAGREGDDHFARFITDQKAYGRMLGYLASLYHVNPDELGGDTVDPEKEREDLTFFYGDFIGTVRAYYERY